jgi:hypothetical protein
MPQSTLGPVLGSDSAKIVAVLEDLQALATPVGDQPFGPLTKELSVKPPGSIPVFDQVLTVDASTQGSLTIYSPDHAVQVFGSGGGTLTAPAGRSFAELHLQAQTALAGQATSHVAAPFSFSIGLKASGEIEVRHLLPVPATQSRLTAFKNVITGASLPQRVDFTKLVAGEVHELNALVSLDLGAKLAAGGDGSFVGDLFQGLSSEVRFHVQYSVEASLSLSLYERMTITTGKALLIDPQRVRIRIERESTRQLTLGATFSLQLQYDLTAGLESLLDHALDLLPFPRAMATLQKVRAIADEVANSDWDQIKAKLTTMAEDEVTDLLGDAGWLDWVSGSNEVKSFLNLSRKAVEAYNGLDGRLVSLWDRLLGRTGLEEGSKTRELLEKLKALDPQHPEELLNPGTRQLIEAVETLSGQSLEEILLSSGASKALQEVHDLATQALAFLNDAPQELFAKIDAFGARTGIKKAVEWLGANATSVDQIKNAATAQVQKLVVNLAGKALDQISAQDVAKIRQWAQRIATVLAAPQQFEDKLRSRIAKLKGQAGFSVAVELDRLSRTTAVLDLEFDPADGDTLAAVRKIGQSDLAAVLRDLPAGQQDPDAAETFPYQIRECVFTSRRVRTSAVNLFFSFFGWTKSRRQQIEEVTVEVKQVGGALTREAVYGGGAVLTSESDGITASGETWLTTSARGTGGDLTAPYASIEGRELRLTYAREDTKSTPEELDNLGILLNNLGFNALPPQHPRSLVLGTGDAAGSQPAATRFSIDLRLPETAVTAFWGDFGNAAEESRWTFDVLNALYRWFGERLITDEVQAGGAMRPTGVVLSRSLQAAAIRDAWIQGKEPLDTLAKNATVNLILDGHAVPVRLAVQKPSGDADWKTLVVLPISRSHHGNALKPLRDTTRLLAKSDQSLRPDDLAALSRSAGRALLACQPSPAFWSNPMLGTWLVISRLSRRAPDALRQASGLATLRWKDASGQWNPDNLATWRLEAGIMVHDRDDATGMFPIVK